MKTAKLGELVKITIGRTPSRDNEDFWDKDKNTSNAWLSIADLLNTDGRVVADSKEYITDEAAKTFAIVPQGTLLVSFKLTLGRLAYAGRDLRTNEAIAALHNDQTEVTNDYLYHYLSRFDWNEYAKADQKVKGLTLNKAKLAEVTVTYPESLEEQQRIVARLDAAFENINLQTNNKPFVRYLFSTIENTKSTQEKVIDQITVNIEHILPQKPGKEWQINSQDLKSSVNRLGNITILLEKINSEMSNKPINKKAEILAKSELKINEEVIQIIKSNDSIWGPAQIGIRQAQLADQADKAWSFTN